MNQAAQVTIEARLAEADRMLMGGCFAASGFHREGFEVCED